MQEQSPLPNSSKPAPWGNYFKEFIMIFLAISLGFFVENLRQDMAEKDLEREFMMEIVENLKYDTTRFRVNFKINQDILADFDTLRAELKNARDGKPNANRLHQFAHFCIGNYSMALLNTNAMTELRSSGSVRLIRNKKLVAHLADYYEPRLKAMDIYKPSPLLVHELLQKKIKHFSMMDMDNFLKVPVASGFDSLNTPAREFDKLIKGPPMKLFFADATSYETYYATAGAFQTSLKFYQFWLLENSKAAIELMDEINKEYHFE